MIELARNVILVFGILVLIGGFTGFLKGKSKASLIAGLISSMLLFVSYFVSQTRVHHGLLLGDATSLALFVVFSRRLQKTKKFMPSGMLMILAAVTALIATFALLKG